MPRIDADIDILSVTKPVATKDYICAWSNDAQHMILKDHKHVRVVYDKDEKIITDRICVECWTTK